MSDNDRQYSARKRSSKPRGRLVWLLGFAECAPRIQELSGKGLASLRHEVWTFSVRARIKGPGDRSDLTVERIARLAAEMGSVMRNLSRSEPGVVRVEGAPLKFYIEPSRPDSRPRYVTDAITAFKLEAADVLAAEGHRVRQCKLCQTLFIRRKGQLFCSADCSRRERERRFKEKHGVEELSERRHRRYVARVAATRGVKPSLIKVQRRRRAKRGAGSATQRGR